ncbi:MAG: Aerobic respiration control sensor protein ArcB, partial [Pseudomonadota bacterium]
LSPDFKSLMNELLQRFTSMAAIPVIDRVEVRPNTIFLLPPRKDLLIEGNQLISRDREKDGSLSLPINTFFTSLAAAWGDRAVAIVLSGTGSDGSHGLLDVRDGGGLVLVQSPESARFDGMPQSAINTGCVDAILAPEEIPAALAAYAADPASRHYAADTTPIDEDVLGMPAILRLLKKQYNIDFSNYKPATIMRRIDRRMAMNLNGEDIESYSKRLLEDGVELNQLYKDLLIGVTRFFRDAEAFYLLKEKVVPSILETQHDDQEVRIWVCGCSTGEEAYSIAILFLEAFKSLGRSPQLKVLATDLHQESLRIAAEGVYSEDRFADMPLTLRHDYFETVGNGHFRVLPHLRKSLIFSPHNLLKDPPFTKLNLVSCRNLLIYLQPSAQARAIATFCYALKQDGVLFLGASETLGDMDDEMEAIDRQWKIFRKVRESGASLNLRTQVTNIDPKALKVNPGNVSQLPRIYDALLDKFIPDGILINDQREILHIFGQAHRFIHPGTGRFSGDVLTMLHHPLSLALSTALRTAIKTQQTVVLKSVSYPEAKGKEARLMLSVDPVQEKSSNALFFMIRFEQELPVIQPISVQPILDFDPNFESASQVQELEFELQKVRESLQSTVEELETTNEELQASNEELLASNEELQSTNEELHSVNEELYSVNAEHELKIDELNQTSSNLRNLMQSTDTATIFIDNDLRIRLFTPRALEIFNLFPQDIGRSLRHFQPKYADSELFMDIEQVIADGKMLERHLEWDTELSYLRRCMAYLDITGKPAGVVINYVDTHSITRVTKALIESEAQLKLILQTVPSAILLVSRVGEIVLANSFADQLFAFKGEGLQGHFIFELLPVTLHEKARDRMADYFNSPCVFKPDGGNVLYAHRQDGIEVALEVTLAPIKLSDGIYALAAVRDITEYKQLEETKQQALQSAMQLANSKGRFLANMSHEIRTPLNAILGFAQLSLDRPYEVEKNRDALQKIVASGRHLLTVINDILDYSKLDAGKVQIEWLAVDLLELLSECVDMCHENAKSKGLLLKLVSEDELPNNFMADPVRLRQILVNLLSNAIKFTEAGQVVLTARLTDSRVLIEVADTGIGIKPEHLPLLFHPFEQVDVSATRRFGGTGLGLVISQRLATLMGGEIVVNSVHGQGSRFTLDLPCRLSPVSSVKPSESAQPTLDQHLQGLHVLVVEDVEFNILLLEEILTSHGLKITKACNGLEAIERIKQQGEHPFDLVLMDIEMPEMDGLQATPIILQMQPHLPVIGLTARAFDEDRKACLQVGMVEHLCKPIQTATLLACIARYAGR